MKGMRKRGKEKTGLDMMRSIFRSKGLRQRRQ
jgi:hypothetical protein